VFNRNKSAIGPAVVPGAAMGGAYVTTARGQSRRSRNSDTVNSVQDTSEQRIQIETRKLRIVYWLAHAPRIFGTRADDQFVDQRIAMRVLAPIRGSDARNGNGEHKCAAEK